MSIPEPLRCRDARAAARSGRQLTGLSATVLAAFAVLDPEAGGSMAWLSWGVVAALAGLLALMVRTDPDRLDRSGVLLGSCVIGIVLICALNVITNDTSAAAQVFLGLPLLWATCHVRRTAAAALTALAVVSQAVVSFVLQPPEAAAIDAGFVGTFLVAMAMVLSRAMHRQDVLVAALREQAAADALTGLATRRALDAAMADAVTAAVPDPGVALVLVDIDSFKLVNDAHGHPVGDDVLVHIASLLRGLVRADDAVVGRLGGDEFAVFLAGCEPAVAERRAREVADAVRSAPLPLDDGQLLELSVSVGVAHVPGRESRSPGGEARALEVRDLYAAADAALYGAKRTGRGRAEMATV